MPRTFIALSIVAPNGTRIARGQKTLEVRSWHPGTMPLRDLVIVENGKRLSAEWPEDPAGRAVAIVDVLEVHAWEPGEVEAACASAWQPGYHAWVLGRVRKLDPAPVVPARLGLYDIEGVIPPSDPSGAEPVSR